MFGMADTVKEGGDGVSVRTYRWIQQHHAHAQMDTVNVLFLEPILNKGSHLPHIKPEND